ncbi:MAG: carboxypeptidase-like regulatory domain-containing protein, partial [Duncaniella sp.]|nr:carboxypeptidase-like regulatory domain-containing protein [Duncaniella sp.]
MKIQFLNPKTRLLLTALIWVCALFPLGAAAQGSFNVSGEVVDKTSGEPLIGVTVIEKSNPTKGTSTDFDGKFNLTVSSGDVVLSFSYVGYASLELKAKDANGT